MKIGERVIVLMERQRHPVVGRLMGVFYGSLLVRVGTTEILRQPKYVYSMNQAKKKPWWKRRFQWKTT